PPPKGPPALQGEFTGSTGEGVLTLKPAPPTQQGYVEIDFVKTARARVRVAGQLNYKQDFTNVPVGAAPGGWLNVQSKFVVVDLDGNKVLSKVNTDPRPPFA